MIKHVLPIHLNPEGYLFNLINRQYALTDCVESYQSTGGALLAGLQLHNQFIGTGYSPEVRLLGDFGSNLYVTREISTETDALTGA